jgi:signal transduction histidine kinase
MQPELDNFELLTELMNNSSNGFLLFRLDPAHAHRYVCNYANKSAHEYTNLGQLEGLSYSEILGQQVASEENFQMIKGYCRFNNSDFKCYVDCTMAQQGEALLCTITAISTSEYLSDHFNQLWSDAEEIMQFGAWVWNVTTKKMIWSAGMYHLHGYLQSELKPDDISFELFKSHIHPDDLEAFSLQANKLFTYQEPYTLEFRLITVKGIEKYVYLRGKNYLDEVSGDLMSSGTIFNVSFIKTIQNELETKVRDLNQSNVDLEQFAYVASHDLQEPLRKIVSFGERLQSKGKENLTPVQLEYLSKILNATERMQSMISNLLDFSIISSTEKPFVKTDLNEVLCNVLTDLEVTIHQKNAIVEYDHLPTIEAVPIQISQLFLNLISNSLKFITPDKIPIIQISCLEPNLNELIEYNLSRNSRYFKIEFQDNGIGFDNENAPKLFDLFKRLRGRSEFSGSGIGLAVCKKVVERHNGLIRAYGEVGKGAVFKVILPLKHV